MTDFLSTPSTPLPTFDTPSDVQWLRSSLEISMADLASLFGAARQEPYLWLDGASTPKAAHIHAVRALIESRLQPSLRPFLRHFWAAHPTPGGSLLDILKLGGQAMPESASLALDALADPLSRYSRQLSNHLRAPIAGGHNDDIYRSL